MNPQGFLVLFQSTSDTIVAGMLLSLAYLKMVQLLKPYTDQELNRIKETSIWQIFFVFLIALLIKMNDVDKNFLAVCLLLVFFANFAILFGQYLVHRFEWLSCGPQSVTWRAGDGEKEMEVEMESATSLVTFVGAMEGVGGSPGRISSDNGPHVSCGHARADSKVTPPSATDVVSTAAACSSSNIACDDDELHGSQLCVDTVEHTQSPFHCEASL